MIVFNTLKKAEHYVKYKRNAVAKDPYYKYHDEQYSYYFISKNKVINSYGWKCGCGCSMGSNTNLVIGYIKNL